MAIAHDNADAIANWTASNPATGSFTCTGTDRALFIGIFTNSTVTAMTATYAGVSMTQLSVSVDLDGNKNFVFYLANPASGSNTLSVTRTGGANMSVVANSKTGVDQTTPVDTSATEDGTASATSYTSNSITVGSSNNWLMSFFRNTDSSTITSSTVTQRAQTTTVLEATYDSNGTVAAGSTSVTYTISPSGRLHGHTLISIKAASASTTYNEARRTFMMMM